MRECAFAKPFPKAAFGGQLRRWGLHRGGFPRGRNAAMGPLSKVRMLGSLAPRRIATVATVATVAMGRVPAANAVPRRVPHGGASGRGPFWSEAGLAALSLRLHAVVDGAFASVAAEVGAVAPRDCDHDSDAAAEARALMLRP